MTATFEVLLDTYFQGWTGFAYDENDAPVAFASVEEALVDLQEAFDSLDSAVREGERSPDQSYSSKDFAIRALSTGDLCEVGLSGGKVALLDEAGNPITSEAALARINQTGRFGIS
jgi:hypothetical protein